MVDTKLIKDTIKELLDANVDKDTIYSTLEDIGVERESIEKYYAEMISETKKEEPEEEKSEEKEMPKDNLSEDKPKYNSITDVDDKKDVKEEPKEDIFKINEKEDKHEEELKTTSEDVNKINETHETKEKRFDDFNQDLDSKDDVDIKNKLSKLEEDILEIKTEVKGLSKIMKNILEENRNILNKL